MRREVEYIRKKIDAIYTAYYFAPNMDIVEAVTTINQNVKPLRDFFSKKSWIQRLDRI